MIKIEVETGSVVVNDIWVEREEETFFIICADLQTKRPEIITSATEVHLFPFYDPDKDSTPEPTTITLDLPDDWRMDVTRDRYSVTIFAWKSLDAQGNARFLYTREE